jgi:hypothetical protein
MTHQPPLIPDQLEPDQAARDAERAEYLERLREKLQDPDFRAIEGFPIGEDDAILALSDPPYYTACPNPFLPEIIARWQGERAQLREELGLPDDTDGVGDDNGDPVRSARFSAPDGAEAPTTSPMRFGAPVYHREPFASDVSEGKNDPIYNAHSYHTKVPHKAIMRYILHYTDPGDVVFDGFCGTGMTGVAAQLCGDLKAVEELGYYVGEDGWIYESKVRSARFSAPSDGAEAPTTNPISRLGARKAALVDLSPAATFIAYNYNTPVDVATFQREAERILREVEEECGWMYETWHPHCDHPQRVEARISYTVWSEVFSCPQCSGEITFLDEALDKETKKVRSEFPCPHCGTRLGKRDLERHLTTVFDPILGRAVETLKLRPAFIEYKTGRTKYTKSLDSFDHGVLERIGQLPTPNAIPSNPLPIAQMYHGSRLAPKGVTHVHHLFLPRARGALGALWTRAQRVSDPSLRAFILFTVEQAIWGMTLLNRYGPTHFSQVNRYLTGVYYISSLISEVSPWYILDGKVKRLIRAFTRVRHQPQSATIATQSAAVTPPVRNSVDYVFTDPPFGENIFYADLNYLIESWHGVRTNSEPEAIIDRPKQKDLRDYQDLMRESFRSFYRWLKPGRWMTVEFHNSRNAVWNAIQEALSSAGFVVADVRTLDKKQKSYRQVTASSVAKQDLIISAYKPRTGFEHRFLEQAGTADGAWAFIRQHLAQLPIAVKQDGTIEVVAERQPYLLFDRMVAFHIQRGTTVPLSAAEFYAGLRQRFVERDGMFFLPDQVAEYDRARLQAAEVAQLALFVSDEKSALQWLRQGLDPATGGQPQTYQDLQPQFLRQLHQARHEALPELSDMLEQNFLQDEAGRWYVPDPSKATDLERLRQRALLREFATYIEGRKRLRQFRSEAVRAGFADAWRQRDYATIVQVAERLPSAVLQEDPGLLMYYDNATLRV